MNDDAGGTYHNRYAGTHTVVLGKIRNYYEETVFCKKKLSSFTKASSPKWDGAMYAGGSRPSCFVIKIETIYRVA